MKARRTPAPTRGLPAQRLSLPGFTLDLEVRPYTLERLRSDAKRAPVTYGAFIYYASGELEPVDAASLDSELN